MRKPTLQIFTAIVSALAVTSCLSARADDKSDINALYAKLSQAFKAKDTKGIVALGTPDFTSKMPGRPAMDMKASEQGMDEGFKAMKSMDQVVMKPDKITIKGKTAVVMGHYSFKATVMGPKGKTQTMTDQGTSKDVLAKTPKGWLFKSTETLTSHQMLDGKPFSMGGPPPGKK